MPSKLFLAEDGLAQKRSVRGLSSDFHEVIWGDAVDLQIEIPQGDIQDGIPDAATDQEGFSAGGDHVLADQGHGLAMGWVIYFEIQGHRWLHLQAWPARFVRQHKV